MIELVLGGARSGKSKFAEQRALEAFNILPASTATPSQENKLIYVATGLAGDGEMAARIAHHQQRRDASWTLLEEPMYLSQVLDKYNSPQHIILVDCLTLWVTNCLVNEIFEEQKDALLALLPELRCRVIFVSNEVGSGIVPLGELSRDFVDASGFLHQSLAAVSDRVTLVVAGLPMVLK